MVEEKRSGSSFKNTLHVWYYWNDRSKKEYSAKFNKTYYFTKYWGYNSHNIMNN